MELLGRGALAARPVRRRLCADRGDGGRAHATTSA